MTKKILPASVLNWTNFKPNRAHWLVGFPILVAFEGIGGVITLGTWGGGYWFPLSSVNLRFWRELVDVLAFIVEIYMSHFAYACKMQYPLNLVLENIEYL